MKKILGKKLALAKETVRELTKGDMENVAGAGAGLVSVSGTLTAPCRNHSAAAGGVPCRSLVAASPIICRPTTTI